MCVAKRLVCMCCAGVRTLLEPVRHLAFVFYLGLCMFSCYITGTWSKSNGPVDSIQLGDTSRQISDKIAENLSHKTRDVFASCCGNNLKSEGACSGFIGLLSRGNLINPFVKLGHIVTKGFALLDVNSNDIGKFSIS